MHIMRRPRYKAPNARYHITARTNRQEMIFDKRFKSLFLKVIREARKKYDFLLVSFCLMNNHPHLVMEPLGKEDISKIMQWILSVFAIRYNKIMGYKGHVFYDRFKSKIIATVLQYLRTLFYIASNPVRAKLVDHPLEYEFNSVTYVRHGLDPGLLDPLPQRFQEALDRFLADYPRERYCRKDVRCSFFDRKPGRPRKK